LTTTSPLKGALIFVLASTLASCGRSEQSLYADRSVRSTPTAAGEEGYLGRWARTEQDCKALAFTFSADRIQAPSGSWCDVGRVEPSPAGYSLATLCQIDGKKPVPGRLLVTLPAAGTGQTMTVEGGPLEQPLGLVRCPVQAQVAAAGGVG
jgi:hypothetical protein